MIDELIEEERNKALLRIQQKEQLIQKKEQLEAEINLLEKKLLELQPGFGSFNIKYPIHVAPKKFNFFQKVFSRKKYKNYLAEIYKYDSEYKIAEEKEQSRIKELNKIQDTVMQLKKELFNINTQIKNLEKSNDENVIQVLEDKEQAIIFLLQKYPNLQYDLNFMKEAVEYNLKFISYDRTDDPSLYIYVIDETKKSDDRYVGYDENYRQQRQAEFEEKAERLKNEILNPSQVPDDKYKIPHKYIYEAIREEYTSHLSSAFKYLEYDGKFPKIYGEELERLWEDSNNIFAIHATSRNYDTTVQGHDDTPRASVESIFRNGLKATNSMGELSYENASPQLTATTYVKGEGLYFLNALNYSYARGYGNIIIQIPKDGIGKKATTAIWGLKDNSTDRRGKAFLLPKYIYGFIENNKFINFEDYQIEKNPHINEENYPFFSMDYSYITSMPAMESEEISKESEVR